MKIHVVVFWVVTLRNAVVGHQRYVHLHSETLISYHSTTGCYNPDDPDM